MIWHLFPDDLNHAEVYDNNHRVAMTAVMKALGVLRYLHDNDDLLKLHDMRARLQDREEAGRLLSKRLDLYKDTNAIVVGIPHGGVSVAAVVAEKLSLPLEVVGCRKIKHPADRKKTIGAVGLNDVFIHDCSHNMPQDYVYRQIALLRNVIRSEQNAYYHAYPPTSLRYKTVILVDDILKSADGIQACLMEIKRQQPLKVIVAIPVVSAEAARLVRAQVDDIVFLRINSSIHSGRDYFIDYPKVEDVKVIELLNFARERIRRSAHQMSYS